VGDVQKVMDGLDRSRGGSQRFGGKARDAEKLQELVKRGVVPFAYGFERTGTAADAIAAYKSDLRPT